jgi:isopentenyl diphosphate isomerase/L-lactate dehydrogenase-like FMN-dependent dehydrogenase
VNEFLRILSRQVAVDLQHLPETLRRRATDEGRVARCLNISDLRLLARRRIPRVVFDYVDGAAWDEVTSRRNREDFGRFALRPRVFVDVNEVDTRTTVLGTPISLPIIGAPTGQTGLVHRDGETAVARGLHASGTLTTLSTAASYSIEEVAAASPGPKWFQLYTTRDRGLSEDLLARARAAGYVALAVTVDVQRSGARERDRRNRFSVPPRITMRTLLDGAVRPRWSANFVRHPRILMANFEWKLAGANAIAMSEFINRQFDPSLSWADFEWLREHWPGPIVVKGILRADDARRAVDHGAAGILASNHGGRQLDHGISAVRALPAIVQEVGADAEVYLDGGVRRGTDVVKALALGARACMIGRPLMYGLGAGGEAGVRRALEILGNEFVLSLALAGCPSLGAVDGSLVELLI